jgi:4-diphosphocytidyl-2C-methyl-D-erythritol kinase
MVVNELEPVVLDLRPELAGALADLRDAGALAAAVSGSGPTVFGVFASLDEARRAASSIPGGIAAAPL